MTPEQAIKKAKEMQEEINKNKSKKIQVNEENVYDLKIESITKDLERLQTIQTIEKPKVFTSVELFLINEIQELKQENKELKQALLNVEIILKEKYKTKIKEMFSYIKTNVNDATNGYWDYDNYGEIYMTEYSLMYLLKDIEKKVKEKFIEE